MAYYNPMTSRPRLSRAPNSGAPLDPTEETALMEGRGAATRGLAGLANKRPGYSLAKPAIDTSYGTPQNMESMAAQVGTMPTNPDGSPDSTWLRTGVPSTGGGVGIRQPDIGASPLEERRYMGDTDPNLEGNRGGLPGRPLGGGAVDERDFARGYGDPTNPDADPRNAGFTINTGYGGGAGGQVPVRDVVNRSVTPDELAENRVAGILRSDSALMRLADLKGRRAASRGGSSGGSYYGGAAQLAAQDMAMPLGMQDANTFARTASENMAATNDRGNNELQAATATNTANISAGASMYGTDVDAQTARDRMGLDRELSAADRGLTREGWQFQDDANTRSDFRREGIDTRAGERQHGYNTDEARQRFGYDMTARDYENRNAVRNYAYQGIVDGFINNPEEWDQGFADQMMSYFGDMSDQMFNQSWDSIFGSRNRPAEPARTGP